MLQLLENQQEEVQSKSIGQIKKELVDIFFKEYFLEFNKKYSEPFVKCLGILKQNFETEEDEELLVEYPEPQEWTNEVHKFLYNSSENWFRKNNRCTFHLFCKHYGRFDHHLKEQRIATDPILSHPCAKCGVIMKYPRSHWVKYRNQDGRCKSCNTIFHVNDVLNQSQTLSDIIQEYKK